MISYYIEAGGITLSGGSPHNYPQGQADLISLRCEQDIDEGEQKCDLIINNKDDKYTGACTVDDQIKIKLINYLMTASPQATTGEIRAVWEFDLFLGVCQNIEFTESEMKIRAGDLGAEFQTDSMRKDRMWDAATDLESMVLDLLKDSFADSKTKLKGTRIDIPKTSPITPETTQMGDQDYQCTMDELAKICNCEYWFDEQGVFNMYNRGEHFSGQSTVIGYAIRSVDPRSVVGYCNKLTGFGNSKFKPGDPGWTMPTMQGHDIEYTQTIGDDGALGGTPSTIYEAPSLYLPYQCTKEEVKKRVDGMLKWYYLCRKDVGEATLAGICPFLDSWIVYTYGDKTKYGKISKKITEYSVDGWLCHLTLQQADTIEIGG